MLFRWIPLILLAASSLTVKTNTTEATMTILVDETETVAAAPAPPVVTNPSSAGALDATGRRSFTWEGLMDALAEQKEQQNHQHQQAMSYRSSGGSNTNGSTLDAIHQFYRDNWIISPINLESSRQVGQRLRQKRPIPQSLYKCGLSKPLTKIEIKYKYRNGQSVSVDEDETEIVVEEVWSGVMAGVRVDGEAASGSSGTSTLQQHQLRRRQHQSPLHHGGDLSSKNITQFTRGASGKVQPFKPGGLTAEDEQITVNVTGKDDDDKQLADMVARSMTIFEQNLSTEEAWSKGFLLTAPHGADFVCGLSYDDVFNKGSDADLATEGDPDDGTTTETGHIQGETGKQQQEEPTGTATLMPTVRLWDHRNFLDDDSLFGSSIASSDDDEGSDDSDDEQEEDSSSTRAEKLDDAEISEQNVPSKQDQSTAVDLPTDVDEVDALLTEMKQTEAQVKGEFSASNGNNKENKKQDVEFNPLELAKQHEQLKANHLKRKSWASEQLLPIKDFDALIPNPAMKYPFTLDPFQQQAVARLERNENVFVAAHTSAGKTVVAEYAVALAQQRGTRCIYTSPIKALSNQKFRDFSLKFGSENVGIVTGDLQINVDDSTVLIMTTEILRSMLYRGADLIRDIESVVFDEVHYINDTERGVVWEEVIIMLPSYVNLIFLSATTPNTFDFSDWIGRTKQKPVYVVKTDYRPVPLSHFLWSNLKLHKIKEGNGIFLDKGYAEAKSSGTNKKDDSKGKKVVPASTGRGPSQLAWQQQGSRAQWMSLVRFLEREGLTPTVIFTFSQKKCEEVANMLRSLDLNTAAETNSVVGFTMQTVARLSPNDARLPQVLTICEMVKRGLGVHHGGLLPILKEMVEILFSRGLVKVLFATETFAMGVNMPAKSVVFNSIRKHDGREFRVLNPGEYTQMAGRAGRRGLDKVGTVIMCCFGEEPPPIGILRTMLTGASTPLKSQFRLRYNMILNLLRVEEMSVESMIKRSFSEFATQRALAANQYPKLLARGKKTLTKLEMAFDANKRLMVGAEDIEEYFDTSSRLLAVHKNLLDVLAESGNGAFISMLEPGRVILMNAAREHRVVRAPALVLATGSSVQSSGNKEGKMFITCMVLLPENFMPSDTNQLSADTPLVSVGGIGSARKRYYGIYNVSFDQVLLITSKKKKVDPKILYASNDLSRGLSTQTKGQVALGTGASSFFAGAKPNCSRTVDDFAGFKARGKKNTHDDVPYGGKKKKDEASTQAEAIDGAVDFLIEAENDERTTGLTPLDYADHLKRSNEAFETFGLLSPLDELVVLLRTCESHRHPSLEMHYTDLERIQSLRTRVDALGHLLSNESLQLFPDFLAKKNVLVKLGYLDVHESVAVKGRVACEINTCDELIMTEILFEGLLNDLEPAEIVAALSAMVYQQKSEDDDFSAEIPADLLHCCQRMKAVARNLGMLQKENGVNVDPDEYAEEAMKFGLVHVTYEWAIGVPFDSICSLTTAKEGSIVRCITRLDELCREVRNSSRVMGDPTLYRKMEIASAAIKRDIVFASSLYVS